jgi:hypothetical protein
MAGWHYCVGMIARDMTLVKKQDSYNFFSYFP